MEPTTLKKKKRKVNMEDFLNKSNDCKPSVSLLLKLENKYSHKSVYP